MARPAARSSTLHTEVDVFASEVWRTMVDSFSSTRRTGFLTTLRPTLGHFYRDGLLADPSRGHLTTRHLAPICVCRRHRSGEWLLAPGATDPGEAPQRDIAVGETCRLVRVASRVAATVIGAASVGAPILRLARVRARLTHVDFVDELRDAWPRRGGKALELSSEGSVGR